MASTNQIDKLLARARLGDGLELSVRLAFCVQRRVGDLYLWACFVADAQTCFLLSAAFEHFLQDVRFPFGAKDFDGCRFFHHYGFGTHVFALIVREVIVVERLNGMISRRSGQSRDGRERRGDAKLAQHG